MSSAIPSSFGPGSISPANRKQESKRTSLPTALRFHAEMESASAKRPSSGSPAKPNPALSMAASTKTASLSPTGNPFLPQQAPPAGTTASTTSTTGTATTTSNTASTTAAGTGGNSATAINTKPGTPFQAPDMFSLTSTAITWAQTLKDMTDAENAFHQKQYEDDLAKWELNRQHLGREPWPKPQPPVPVLVDMVAAQQFVMTNTEKGIRVNPYYRPGEIPPSQRPVTGMTNEQMWGTGNSPRSA